MINNSINEVFLPQEIYGEIFSYLSGPELTKCSRVSKEWHKIAGSDRLWSDVVENQYAFGAKKWKKYLGDIGQETPLPNNILKVLRSPCPFFSGNQVGKTHVLVWLPKTVDSKPLTINNLGDIVIAKYFPNTYQGYRYIELDIRTKIGDRELEGTGWVLMTRDMLNESREKSFDEHIALVKKYAEKSTIAYEMPMTLEAITCIFAEYVQSECKTRLFSDNPWTFTRCQEKINIYNIVVGGNASCGLHVYNHFYAYEKYGVAALGKFF